MPPLMIVLIPYINLLNLSRTMKCLFLRIMEPLNGNIKDSIQRDKIIFNSLLKLQNIRGSDTVSSHVLHLWQYNIDVSNTSDDFKSQPSPASDMCLTS